MLFNDVISESKSKNVSFVFYTGFGLQMSLWFKEIFLLYTNNKYLEQFAWVCYLC